MRRHRIYIFLPFENVSAISVKSDLNILRKSILNCKLPSHLIIFIIFFDVFSNTLQQSKKGEINSRIFSKELAHKILIFLNNDIYIQI